MALFGFSKKKEEKGCCCNHCGEEQKTTVEIKKEEDLSIKVLGSGCAKCNQLEENTKEALKQLEMDVEIEHVTDFSKIAAYGVMSTPALVVNGQVVSYGKILKQDEVIEILKKVK
ncbi:thioredoxin family protein [Anaerovorax sp. IOR16]|uniref:thioredoxin family protein n=1 Tax=Anaerovorax sp. IOR16 TaxID=2773458 RepID=UPI0019D05A97|nr:thioredoxin family protein [Anaerovorax sp. IOR16]